MHSSRAGDQREAGDQILMGSGVRAQVQGSWIMWALGSCRNSQWDPHIVSVGHRIPGTRDQLSGDRSQSESGVPDFGGSGSEVSARSVAHAGSRVRFPSVR
ncbi:hypothetical protein Droror1_Dr00013549 [Drosera rotundifolia]